MATLVVAVLASAVANAAVMLSLVKSWLTILSASTVKVLLAALYVSVPLYPSPMVNDSFNVIVLA